MTSAREGGCHFEYQQFKKYVNSLANSELIRTFAL